jgi:hypothetical protein
MDGYFYIKQILTLGSRGEFYFRDYSLAFLLPTLLYTWLQDELMCYQLSIVSVMMGMAFVLVLLGNHLYPEKRRPWHLLILLLALFGLMSDRSFYELSFTYLKSATGLLFFLFGFYFTVKSRDEVGRRSFYWALLFFALAVLSHKTSFLLIGLTAFCFLKLSRRTLVYFLGGGAAGAVLFALLFSSGWHYLAFLGNQFQKPDEMSRWLTWLYKNQNWVFAGLVFGPLSLICALLEKDFVRRRIYLFLFCLFFLAWCPFFKQNMEAPSYRLMLLQFSLSPAIFILLSAGRKKFFALTAVAIALMGYQWREGKNLHGYFKGFSRMDHEVGMLETFIAPGDHLTCHHGLEFYVDYKTRIRCRSFISQKPEQQKFRVVTVSLDRGPWSKARLEINQEALMRMGDDYFLVPEDYWLELREKYKLPDTWRNPMAVRPAHIYE